MESYQQGWLEVQPLQRLVGSSLFTIDVIREKPLLGSGLGADNQNAFRDKHGEAIIFDAIESSTDSGAQILNNQPQLSGRRWLQLAAYLAYLFFIFLYSVTYCQIKELLCWGNDIFPWNIERWIFRCKPLVCYSPSFKL